MTKSAITRERLEWLSQISCRDDIEDIGGDEIRELASMALAAMDSEPVADVVAWSHPTEERTCDIRWRRHDVESGPLYRHAQPAPVVPDALEKAQQENTDGVAGMAESYETTISMLRSRIAELESRTVKLPDDAEHDIMAPVAAYLSEKFKWDGSAARWDGRNEYDVLADRVKYALRMVIRRAAGIKVEAE
ncbi:TPA: hypothetical protein ACW70F_005945 [Klebsiella michiganensis]|nr:hypothetical protein [Klebsiella michiganensis]